MKVSDIFADYDYRNQADKLWNSVPMIPLNGMKSRATGFQWQKIDGSPLKYTREFETVDIDYGFTAFTENTIRSKAPNETNNKNKNNFRCNEGRTTESHLRHTTKQSLKQYKVTMM